MTRLGNENPYRGEVSVANVELPNGAWLSRLALPKFILSDSDEPFVLLTPETARTVGVGLISAAAVCDMNMSADLKDDLPDVVIEDVDDSDD